MKIVEQFLECLNVRVEQNESFESMAKKLGANGVGDDSDDDDEAEGQLDGSRACMCGAVE